MSFDPRTLLPVVAAFMALWGLAHAEPQSPQPFRSGVAVIELNVGVLDAEGKPVPDLRADEFDVRVQGRERRVAVARFRTARSDAPADAAVPGVSFAANTAGAPGQIIVLAVDLENMKAGHERVMLKTAEQLITSAAPQDAIGFLPIPGKAVDLTRDHAKVLHALSLVRGTTRRTFRRFSLSVVEALAFEVMNRRVMAEVVDRECPEWLVGCPTELRDGAVELLRDARQHTQTLMTNLAALAKRLQIVDAPKTLVLISGGLPFEPDSLKQFEDAKRQITASGITVYVVQLHMPETDASNQRPSGVESYLATDLDDGLANFASMTGGRFFAGVGTAAGPFDRIRNAVSHSYMLGVEIDPAERAGKPLDVRVEVRRPKLTVTAPLQVTPRAPAATMAVRLAHAFAAPVGATALPMSAAAFVARGDDPGTMKVIVFGEIDGSPAAGSPPQYALRIVSGDRAVFETNGDAAPGARGAQVLTAAQLPPGTYVLKLGAADGSRVGTIELPLTVALRASGALQFSDLITGSAADGFRPAISLRAGERAAALVEAYSQATTELDALSATVAIRRAGEERTLQTATVSIGKTDDPGRRVLMAEIPTDGLPAGVYTVEMRIRRGTDDVAAVSRQIRINE